VTADFSTFWQNWQPRLKAPNDHTVAWIKQSWKLQFKVKHTSKVHRKKARSRCIKTLDKPSSRTGLTCFLRFQRCIARSERMDIDERMNLCRKWHSLTIRQYPFSRSSCSVITGNRFQETEFLGLRIFFRTSHAFENVKQPYQRLFPFRSVKTAKSFKTRQKPTKQRFSSIFRGEYKTLSNSPTFLATINFFLSAPSHLKYKSIIIIDIINFTPHFFISNFHSRRIPYLKYTPEEFSLRFFHYQPHIHTTIFDE
jgi:hypothetical protein